MSPDDAGKAKQDKRRERLAASLRENSEAAQDAAAFARCRRAADGRCEPAISICRLEG